MNVGHLQTVPRGSLDIVIAIHGQENKGRTPADTLQTRSGSDGWVGSTIGRPIFI